MKRWTGNLSIGALAIGAVGLFTLPAACSDDAPGTGSGESDTSTAGTGTEDEVGEESSSEGTTEESTESTEETTESTEDGCVVGSEGCECTPGGGCDPGLTCEDGTCVPESTDTTDTTDTGDTDTGDTTDTDTTDTTDTGNEIPPYGPCPNFDDDECAMGQICVAGDSQGVEWTLCTEGCNDPDQCDVVDGDSCADLPGDGEFMGWCSPVVPCSFGNPCPDGMQCLAGFQNNPAVCVWPLN